MTPSPKSPPDKHDLIKYLSKRADPSHIERRLQIEQLIEAAAHRNKSSFWKKIGSTRWLVKQALKISLLGNRARRNALAITLHSNEIRIPALPETLHGAKILHLSDLHIESIHGLVDKVVDIVNPLQPDVTVITGDIRSRTFGPVEPSLQMMAAIKRHIKGDCFAVLGNHDSIRMLPVLEQMGISVLLNESTSFSINKQQITLIGVDDPSDYYRCDNLLQALETTNNTASDLRILLAHSPDCIDEATNAEIDVYLCGHTHGGQICLPGGMPIVRSSSCKRRYCSGRWTKSNMHGYTSRGIGTSVAAARFNCPPEITMHTLVRADRQT